MPETKSYDLVIIGGGPAGLTAAVTAADNKKSVVLIDSNHELGGAGINTGTVPSKTLRETALALTGMRSRDLYGVDLSIRGEVTIKQFLGHEQQVRSTFNQSLKARLKSHNAEAIFATAKFVDPHVLSITPIPGGDGKAGEAFQIRGECILIATGSSPMRPELFPFDKGEIYDSDTILQLDRIPKTMAVIGSGVIGSEYASTFAALGAQVHIIDGRDKLLPFLDPEISEALLTAMERNGIKFHWECNVAKCERLPGDGVKLDFDNRESLTVDEVLVAAGRQSNVGQLDLEKAGVATGKRGLITVDHEFRTNVPHIFAAGDVIGFPALASTSMEQARRAAGHAVGAQVSQLSQLLPNGIYTIPEVSMVGETEDSLKKKGIEYIVGRSRYEENARGQIIGDKDGFLKLLFRRDNMKLIGVHVIGELATEIVHIGLMAMLTGSTTELFVESCFNIPTLSVLYKVAALDAIRAEAALGAK